LEATDVEGWEYKSLIRKVEQLKWDIQEAKKDSYNDVEREHAEFERGEAPTKRQKTREVLDLNEY
jgi:hypothetical protein